jgi:hypothetical protein
MFQGAKQDFDILLSILNNSLTLVRVWRKTHVFCLEGQGISPYEQNTQQSSFSGRSIVSQLLHL